MDGQDLLAHEQAIATQDTGPSRPDPVVRTITFSDITDAIGAGLRDFQRAPMFGLVFGIAYCLGGIMTILSFSALEMPYLSYPIAAGFAIAGPLVAIGLYEVSRLLERGEEISWNKVVSTVLRQSGKEIGWMSFVVLFVLMMWMYQVRLLLALFLANESMSTMREFLQVVLTTPQGWTFLAIGHVIGAILSMVMFSLTVVSFPILLDRNVDFITAMITSVRSVLVNPVPMMVWAAIIVALLIAASVPFFLGLVIILPILGHTSWHLYRKLVAPEEPEQAAEAA